MLVYTSLLTTPLKAAESLRSATKQYARDRGVHSEGRGLREGMERPTRKLYVARIRGHAALLAMDKLEPLTGHQHKYEFSNLL